MELYKLNEDRRTVFAAYIGEKIAIEYDPRRYDEPIFAEYVRLSKLADDDPNRMRVNLTILGRMLVAWDLTEGCNEDCAAHKRNGSGPICRQHATPVTPEAIAGLPHRLRMNMVNAMIADLDSGGDDPKLNSSS